MRILYVQISQRLITSRLKLVLFVSVILFLSYGAGVIKSVVVSDDYGFLNHERSLLNTLRADGRFFASAFLHVLYFLFGIENILSVLRVTSFVGLLISALLIGFWIDNVSKTDLAHKASTLSFVIPGFIVYAQVAYGFTLSLGLLLSVVGGILLSKRSVNSWLMGLLFVLLAFATYQPAAVFCVNMFFLNYIFRQSNEKALKDLIRQLLLVAIVAFSYLAIVSTLFEITKTAKKDRFRFIDPATLFEKIEWFVTRPLVLLHLPFTLRSPSVLEIGLFATPMLIAVWIFIRKFDGPSISRVSMRILVILWTCQAYVLSPLIFTTENQVELRFLAPAQWLMSFMFIWVLLTWVNSTQTRVRRFQTQIRASVLHQMSLLLLCLLFIISANYRYFYLVSVPYERKSAFLEYELSQCKDKKSILIVKRDSWPSRNLLGVWSQVTDLQSEWVPVSAVQFILGGKHDSEIMLVESDVVANKDNNGACIVALDRY